jgi:hypothetical protein
MWGLSAMNETAKVSRMPPSTGWKESPSPDEEERFGRYAAELGAMQKAKARSGAMSRALHAKGNLGVLAEFEVLPELPEEARMGLFREPKTYAALARFSNGTGARQADVKPDVRGLAVKIIGVQGKKIIPGMEDAKTQDFLAIRTPSVPMRNADEFMTLVRAASTPALAPLKLIFGLGFGRGIGLLKKVVAGLKQPMSSLAETAYYSALPVRHGPYAVHFAFVPIRSATDDRSPTVRGASPDWLGEELTTRLKRQAVSYDFRIQFYQDEEKTPIEDASVEWREADAPYVTIGRLTLLQQDAGSARGRKVSELVETLAFDPWHALEEHKPLGGMMRARNHAYRVSTQARGVAPEPESLPSFD